MRTRDSFSTGMRIWVLPPAKLPKLVAMLATSEGILEWLVEERQIKYQFQAQDQSQQQGVQEAENLSSIKGSLGVQLIDSLQVL